MDVIIIAVGEFVWTASCAVINFCVSSGFSAVAVFISFLCAILASAFYKYTTSREQMSLDDSTCTYVTHENDNDDDDDDGDLDKPITIALTTEESSTPPVIGTDESMIAESMQSLSEIEVYIEENPSEDEGNNEQISNDFLIDTIEGSEEEIQKQQIANIYRLLNDQSLINNWTTTDFLDQLKMYGLEIDEDDELQSA